MATPQGNFAAYKELKYRPELKDNTIDFINLGIDRLIKEGKARDAAKMKALQEQRKGYYDIIKDIKIDPINTIPAFQDYYNQMLDQTVNAIDEAKIKSLDSNVPIAEQRRLTQKALQMHNGYMQVGTFLGNKEQLDAFKKKIETDTSKIWKGDKGMRLMTALKSNAMWIGYDKNGNAVVKYLDPFDPPLSSPKELSFSEATQYILNPYEEELINKKDGLYDQMKQEAVNMFSKDINGIGGNRTIETFRFNPKDAEKSFDIRFGDYNLNNPDKYLQQFAFDVLNGGEIQSKADWDKVKKAYVDKMDIYVKEEKSIIDKYNANQLAQQKADLAKTKAQTAKINKSMQENTDPIVSNQGEINIKQYNSEGKYIGHSTTQGSTVVIPGTQNTFTVIPFKSKDGKSTYNKYFIGGLSKGGRIVTNEIKDAVATLKTFGKNVDAIKVIAEAKKGAVGLVPISSENPIKIKPKTNSQNKGNDIDLDIFETQIAPKAKANTRDALKDLINNSID